MPEERAVDRALMTRIREGDSRALAALIARWDQRLLLFIYRYVGNAETARDLTQETFVRIYRARERFDLERPFSTWMFGIATNLCRSHQRWRRRHAEAPLGAAGDQLPAPDLAPDRAAQREDAIARVQAAVAKLPHRLRACLLLHYYEGMSYREIGEVVGCAPRGVEARLYRARRSLARDLQRRDDSGQTKGRRKPILPSPA